jgi:hypothetical protein
MNKLPNSYYSTVFKFFAQDPRKNHDLRQAIDQESNYVVRQALRTRARRGWQLDLFSTQLSRQVGLTASIGKYKLWKRS